eukprot:scaffold3960_cov116-Isochrysis_galbana.AAC.12
MLAVLNAASSSESALHRSRSVFRDFCFAITRVSRSRASTALILRGIAEPSDGHTAHPLSNRTVAVVPGGRPIAAKPIEQSSAAECAAILRSRRQHIRWREAGGLTSGSPTRYGSSLGHDRARVDSASGSFPTRPRSEHAWSTATMTPPEQ